MGGIFMKCPYCNGEMLSGNLHAASERGVFWLPADTELDGWVLTQKWVEAHNGFVLDRISKIGFISIQKPESAYCPTCKIVISRRAD